MAGASANDFSRSGEGIAKIKVKRLAGLDHAPEQAGFDLILYVANGQRADANAGASGYRLSVVRHFQAIDARSEEHTSELQSH
jgi:hypothetical protein